MGICRGARKLLSLVPKDEMYELGVVRLNLDDSQADVKCGLDTGRQHLCYQDSNSRQTLYNALAVFQLVIICCVALDGVPYLAVYSQSAATPIYTMRCDVGQPAVWPMVPEKLHVSSVQNRSDVRVTALTPCPFRRPRHRLAW